jgi:hypothetical protein
MHRGVALAVICDRSFLSAANGRIAHQVVSTVQSDGPSGFQLDLNGVTAAVYCERPAGIAEQDRVAAAVQGCITAAEVGGDGAAALCHRGALRIRRPEGQAAEDGEKDGRSTRQDDCSGIVIRARAPHPHNKSYDPQHMRRAWRRRLRGKRRIPKLLETLGPATARQRR